MSQAAVVARQMTKGIRMHHAFIVLLICCAFFRTAALAATSDIDRLIITDALGYACIDEAHFIETDESPALAFSTGGKIRLPRTCVDDPCHAALTQRELSQLTGTDPRIPRFANEWNDYYARYADYCRKETTPNGEDVALSSQDFWDRTRRRSQVAQTIAGVSPVLPQSLLIDLSPTTKNGVTARSFTPFPKTVSYPIPSTFRTEEAVEETRAVEQSATSESGESLKILETNLAAVPVHGSLIFMLTSLVAILCLQRRQS